LRRWFSSPGATTIDSAERIGIRPVMNEARPAVQLACPYQLVKTAPSLAIRSIFGVGWPSELPPPLYAPKSFQPVSSVISITMLGFCCANPTRLATSATSARRAIQAQRILSCYGLHLSPPVLHFRHGISQCARFFGNCHFGQAVALRHLLLKDLRRAADSLHLEAQAMFKKPR
jgi:hypothetical protein